MAFFRCVIETCVFPDPDDAKWKALDPKHRTQALALFEADVRSRQVDNKYPDWSAIVVEGSTPEAAALRLDNKVLKGNLGAALTLGGGETIYLEPITADFWIPSGTHGHLGRRAVEVKKSDNTLRVYTESRKVKVNGAEHTLSGLYGVTVYYRPIGGIPA